MKPTRERRTAQTAEVSDDGALSFRVSDIPAGRTWSPTPQLVWADDGGVTPWLAQIWICHETGEYQYRPLGTVKL